MEEFQKLKDMYLISRGELFATFLESSKSILNKPVDQNFEYSNSMKKGLFKHLPVMCAFLK